MKIRVGGKYRMKAYPSEYLYVQILGLVEDILPGQGKSYYNNKQEGSNQFYGVIVYKHGTTEALSYDPNMGTWGDGGEWDGAFFEDANAIAFEIQPNGIYE